MQVRDKPLICVYAYTHIANNSNETADIVTPDAIYEIKSTLSRKNLRRAIDQAVSFRKHFDQSVKIVVVGYQDDKDPVDIAYAQSQGVEVMFWNDHFPRTEP